MQLLCYYNSEDSTFSTVRPLMLLLAVLESSHKSILTLYPCKHYKKITKNIKAVKEEKYTQIFKIPISQAPSVPSESIYLPIHFSKKLINGLSWIGMHWRFNSLPTNRVQLINKYNAWCICFCFPWQKKNSRKTFQLHKRTDSVSCNLGFYCFYYSWIIKCSIR